MARLPEVPGLSELKAESSPGRTYIVGNIMPNRKFKWAVAAQCEMQLPQDSYWAGVLHRPYEIAGPLPWNDFNRHLHLRISREGRQKELAHGWPPCCSGLGDPITGRLYFMDGDVSVWEKSEDLDRSAAGLLMVRWGRGLRFTDGFRDAWGELFDRAARCGEAQGTGAASAPPFAYSIGAVFKHRMGGDRDAGAYFVPSSAGATAASQAGEPFSLYAEADERECEDIVRSVS